MTDSLGMVQVRGLASALAAANLALHTADVRVAGFSYLQDGQVTVSLRGSVDSVRAAVDAVRDRPDAETLGSSVIGRVAPSVEGVVQERSVTVGGRVGAPGLPGRGKDRPAGAGPGKA